MNREEKHKAEIQKVGDAIRQLLQTYRLEQRFDEATLIAAWPELVGAAIARRTRKVYVHHKVLYVELTSSAMKADFMLHRQRVLELLHQKFGRHIITDIVVR
jgi:predicted nucleic acid-binding Zn ribbon protein